MGQTRLPFLQVQHYFIPQFIFQLRALLSEVSASVTS
jgi:hypothetical protein